MDQTPTPTLFDWRNFETADAAELEIKHPLRRGVLTGMVIQLAGPMHPDRTRIEREIIKRNQARMEQSGGFKLPEPEEQEAAMTEKLVACTLGWRGAAVQFSPALARALYTDPARLWLREQVRAFLEDQASFTRECAKA